MAETYTLKSGRKIFFRKNISKKKGDYLYFIHIGEGQVYKIGTTNNVLRRMKEHSKYFDENIEVLWVSPCYSKYTTLRIEDRQKDFWIENSNWEYIRNDRFIIPQEVKSVVITVRRDYEIPL